MAAPCKFKHFKNGKGIKDVMKRFVQLKARVFWSQRCGSTSKVHTKVIINEKNGSFLNKETRRVKGRRRVHSRGHIRVALMFFDLPGLDLVDTLNFHKVTVD